MIDEFEFATHGVSQFSSDDFRLFLYVFPLKIHTRAKYMRKIMLCIEETHARRATAMRAGQQATNHLLPIYLGTY